jgi:predicted helicase
MTTEPIDLFYSYAHEDEVLRDQLNKHLANLRRQGLIRAWYDHDIQAGGLWAEEIKSHLASARILLLLISPDFIASDYCYGVEMKQALKRDEAGEACVIPIILRPCDWENAPFAKLQALPKNAEAVTLWANQDAAFTDITKGIRRVIEKLGESSPGIKSQVARKKNTRTGEGIGGKKHMVSMPEVSSTSATLNTSLKKAAVRYTNKLDELKLQADNELGLRPAFYNLLDESARLVRWTLIQEQTIETHKGKIIRPDGILRDEFFIRGYWEAKGPDSDLEKEIEAKRKADYPLTNTLFENTRQAVLFQDKKRVPVEFDLSKPKDVEDLLHQFLTYTEPDIENFEAAVDEFKERIPELARAVLAIIKQEHKLNKKFIAAFDTFAELCRTSLNPQISTETINEMLVQHLLTERLFRTVFNNPDFVNNNVIAQEIEKVIKALASRSFNRYEFLKSLDRFYVAIESAAKGIESWSERQHFLNTVYERFFQGFSVKQADTFGIVYTPQEIVDFMCVSVDEVLKKEFGLSIVTPGVQILDPAAGTGSFIVNLLHRIPPYQLRHKYTKDLFCNEIMLLPYYIASLNIEHEYYEKMGEYEPFEGICFVDTLGLAEGKQLSLWGEENTARVVREKAAEITVVIGNPPYNAWQKSENDNNKNPKYPIIDQSIRETYAKASKASNKNALSDVYVKFFRWATDRLDGRDGVVCLVTNNSFVDQFAFDGMRMQLQKDFTKIYHLDLHGNVRKNPKLSGTTHNVFGIQVGVGITIAVRNSNSPTRGIYYHRVPEFWRKTEKLAYLTEKQSLTGIDWLELRPDARYTWITAGMQPEFEKLFPMGTKAAKVELGEHSLTIFKTYGRGVATSRDNWVYDYHKNDLINKVVTLIEAYNGVVDKWRRRSNRSTTVDDVITYEDTKIKWSRDLKLDLQRGHYATYEKEKVRTALYRPFCKQYLFFDRVLNEEVYQLPQILPNPSTEEENVIICLTDLGSEKPFMVLASNVIPDLHLVGAGCGTQCFPFYTYSEDGTNRRENITDWALKQFQSKYSDQVTKWDIFHYVYALLHHPQYRERYAENLKRDLPHIPLVKQNEAFDTCKRIGEQLMNLHLTYEQEKEYPLEWVLNESTSFSWRVEKMKLTPDKTAVIVNKSLTLAGIPQECFQYRLGNRSALEWVIDQYQISEDKRSGIESDPNNLDDPEYIIRLVGRVVKVSVETVKMVNELAQAVRVEDWLDETVEVGEALL